jgi:pimeloyl-ACP methyl ester carboxylesterase
MAQTLAIPTSNGASLAAERFGESGGPVAVLLHAGVADRRCWHGVAGPLAARGVDVVAYDRRGFGETAATAEPHSDVDDLIAVLDATTDGRPVCLVGNSMGGRVALDLALRAPDRVAGLVLLAPAVSGAPEIGDDDLDPPTRTLGEAIDRAYEAGDLDELNRLEVHLWLDGPSAPEGRVGPPARDLALAMNAVALRSGMPEDSGEGDEDAWSKLEQIALPVTMAWGALDLPPVIDRCRTAVSRLPDVRATVEWPGVAHLPSLEVPDRVATLVLDAIA